MKEKLLISACLMGERCRYDGKGQRHPLIEALSERYDLIPVCPEQLGGLPTPRTPSERRGKRVIAQDGRDVTEAFRLGADKALYIVLEQSIPRALLKERSPSCGFGEIYDGSFSGRRIPGNGVAAETLSAHGIKIWGESRMQELLKYPRET